jgi:hypothetical protein
VRKAEIELGKGRRIPEVCKKLKITESRRAGIFPVVSEVRRIAEKRIEWPAYLN